MDITPLTLKGRLLINRYGNGGFVVNEISYKENILILSDRVAPWTVVDIGDISEESLRPVLESEPPVEILLIGAGRRFAPLPPELRALLRNRGIAADIMDTGAACRTYNVLMSEDRRAAAALIAV